MKGQWAKTIITCFARFGGRPVGIVANQPKQLGGILDNDSADKAARFVNLCNAFAIPLVFLQDVPGLHGRHEGRGRRDHPPRRQDALRGRQRDRAEDHRDHAQGLRRRLLRDERPRLRARPDRRLAERRDQRDGRRGGRRDRVPQTGRGGRGPGGQEGRADRGLPQDLRRLHRRRQRHDRRRDRPARDARDDLPRRWRWRRARRSSGRGSGTGWCPYEPRGSGRHHLLDLGGDRQPRAVPGDPLHAGGVRRRGAADRGRGRRDDPHPRAQTGRHAEL